MKKKIILIIIVIVLIGLLVLGVIIKKANTKNLVCKRNGYDMGLVTNETQDMQFVFNKGQSINIITIYNVPEAHRNHIQTFMNIREQDLLRLKSHGITTNITKDDKSFTININVPKDKIVDYLNLDDKNVPNKYKELKELFISQGYSCE